MNIFTTPTLLHSCVHIFLADSVKAIDEMWIVGDNFTVKSYRKHFLLRDDNMDGFIKSMFEHKIWCNSKFNCKTDNMILGIYNTVASALNNNDFLPKYILIVLDDDLITYLRFQGPGFTQIMGSWME